MGRREKEREIERRTIKRKNKGEEGNTYKLNTLIFSGSLYCVFLVGTEFHGMIWIGGSVLFVELLREGFAHCYDNYEFNEWRLI